MEALQTCSVSSKLFIRGDNRRYQLATPEAIVEAALQIVGQNMGTGDALTSPQLARDYARMRLAKLEHEVFALFLLDNTHRLIEYVELFRGTVASCTVYPREVVKLALARNAAAIILAHNHPSGIVEPSQADLRVTEKLTSSLALIEVRVIDHLIVGGPNILSFSERGLL